MQRGSPAALNGHSSTGFFFHPERRKFAKRPRGGIGSSKRAAGNGARCQMAFSAVVFEVKNVSGQANRTAAWIRICSSRGNMASAILDDIIQSLKKQVSFGLVFLRFAYASLLGGKSDYSPCNTVLIQETPTMTTMIESFFISL